MGIGHVQGRSRVPPDHPKGGAGGELYSKDLWRTHGGECGLRIADCGIIGQRCPKPDTNQVHGRYEPCAWEGIGRCKPGTWEVNGRYMRGTSHPNTTWKPRDA